MSRPLPPIKNRFKKGQSGNPHGRVPNPAMRALRLTTVDSYREVIQLVINGNLSELKAMIENPETSALQVGVATAFFKAIKTGDYTVIERIAERIVGKIPEELKVTSNNMTVLQTVDPKVLQIELKKLEDDI